MNAKEIIRKWYEKIGFPSRYDAEFYAALEAYEIDPSVTVETYDLNEEDGKKTFYIFCISAKLCTKSTAKRALAMRSFTII